MEKVTKCVFIIMCVVFTLFIGALTFNLFFPVGDIIEPEEEVIEVQDLTIEQAMQNFKDEVKFSEDYAIYVTFPPAIMQELFTRLGTNKSVSEYVAEYQKNREYYISKQIGNQLEETGLKVKGPDGDKIEKIEIKTKLKSEQDEPIPINVTVSDSLAN